MPPSQRAPQSLVVTQGDVVQSVRELMGDFRKVMLPHTADKLKVRATLNHCSYLSRMDPICRGHP